MGRISRLTSIVPLVLLVVSLLYLVFAVNIEPFNMIGDQSGWDPGTRAIPVGLGVLMVVLSSYLFVRELRTPDEQNGETDPALRRVLVTTVIVCGAYVLLFRTVGFVLLTSGMLFLLTYFNSRQDVRVSEIPSALVGTGLTWILAVALYSAGRYVSRILSLYGRQLEIPFLRESTFLAAVSLILTGGLFLVVLFGTRRRVISSRGQDVRRSLLVAAATTQFLYLAFRQVFSVELVRGWVFW
ncbi:MAG: tripartite tricarboxylate transporter TctB family protein [Spirochaetota bacterium]|nr:tripartite tricarboxylate transporter TctB family protein [Spirochaetota bacterium]